MIAVRTIGRVVHRRETVASTMDEAARLAAAGAVEGTVIVANNQTAGRGRAGRHWTTAPGDALTLSILLRPGVDPACIGVLSLLAGVAIATAIEQTSRLPVWLKWPNDVWLGGSNTGRKVAGVLVTSRLNSSGIDHVLIGIGVNDRAPSVPLPPGATSIASERDQILLDREDVKPPDREELLDLLLTALDQQYKLFLESDGQLSLDPWRKRAVLLGEPVVIEDGPRRMNGLHAGVNDAGNLLLRSPDGAVTTVFAGDLTRGPRQDLAGGSR